MYIYIYVFLIAANRHGNLLILIFLDERSPEERETFRFRFEGYSIIDGNVRENLHTIKDYSANNRGYIYIYTSSMEEARGSFGRVFYRAL